MSNVNFVEQFNLFMEYARENCIPGRESMLWMCLFYFANKAAVYNGETQTWEWPDDFFSVSNAELDSYGQFDKRSLYTMRNRLKQRGLIDFINGEKRTRNPTYRLFYLARIGCKIAPNNTTNNTTNGTTNNTTNAATRSATNGGGIGYKNAPNQPPIYLNKNTKRDSNTRVNGGVKQPGAPARASLPDSGLVDLDGVAALDEGLIPLPWEYGGEPM